MTFQEQSNTFESVILYKEPSNLAIVNRKQACLFVTQTLKRGIKKVLLLISMRLDYRREDGNN